MMNFTLNWSDDSVTVEPIGTTEMVVTEDDQGSEYLLAQEDGTLVEIIVGNWIDDAQNGHRHIQVVAILSDAHWKGCPWVFDREGGRGFALRFRYLDGNRIMFDGVAHC